MEEKTGNEYIDPYNHFKGYQASIDKLKQNNPELIAFDKLCYDIFEMTEDGKELMKLMEDKYFFSKTVEINHPNFVLALTLAEGMREFLRTVKQVITSHKQRISAEATR